LFCCVCGVVFGPVCQLWLGSSFSRSDFGLRMIFGLCFELCVFVVFVVLSSALSVCLSCLFCCVCGVVFGPVCQLWLGSSFSRSDFVFGLRMIFAAGLCFELCVFVVFVVLSSALSVCLWLTLVCG